LAQLKPFSFVPVSLAQTRDPCLALSLHKKVVH